MQTYKALEIWSAQTLCDIGILLSVISFLLHIGRPYFERILSRFTLRVAADVWWLIYIVLRDGTLFFAFVLGFFHLNLDLMADIKVGVPFVPLGTVALAAALLFKVFWNSEDVNRKYVLSSAFVALGTFLNVVGFVLVMESPGEEYSAARTAFWQTLKSWRSNANPELSTISFYLSFALLLMIVGAATVRAFRLFLQESSKGVRDV
jgi:hypothetical protein